MNKTETYVFLRRPEDEGVEDYFRNEENIKHLLSFLKNIDTLAFLSDILHEYINQKEDLKRAIFSEDKYRLATVKEKARKLDRILNEILSLLEFGNLQAFARANYFAFVEARQEKPKAGLFKLLNALRDEDIKLTIGFLLLLMKNVANIIKAEDPLSFKEESSGGGVKDV